MFASNVDFDVIRNAVDNPHGAEIIAFDLSGSFQSCAAPTTAQPLRGVSFGL